MCEPRRTLTEEESAARFGPEFLRRWKAYKARHPEPVRGRHVMEEDLGGRPSRHPAEPSPGPEAWQ